MRNIDIEMDSTILHGMQDAFIICQEIEVIGFCSIKINSNNPAFFIEALIPGPVPPPQGPAYEGWPMEPPILYQWGCTWREKASWGLGREGADQRWDWVMWVVAAFFPNTYHSKTTTKVMIFIALNGPSSQVIDVLSFAHIQSEQSCRGGAQLVSISFLG